VKAKKFFNSSLVSLVAIICLTVIEIYAINHHIDGTLMTLVIAAISGLGGYKLSQSKSKNSNDLKGDEEGFRKVMKK